MNRLIAPRLPVGRVGNLDGHEVKEIQPGAPDVGGKELDSFDKEKRVPLQVDLEVEGLRGQGELDAARVRVEIPHFSLKKMAVPPPPGKIELAQRRVGQFSDHAATSRAGTKSRGPSRTRERPDVVAAVRLSKSASKMAFRRRR